MNMPDINKKQLGALISLDLYARIKKTLKMTYVPKFARGSTPLTSTRSRHD